MALGASSTYMARPFLIAALARGEKGVENYIESLKVEIQMLTSALGKYDLREISLEDVASLDKDVAEMYGIPYVYSKRWPVAGSDQEVDGPWGTGTAPVTAVAK